MESTPFWPPAVAVRAPFAERSGYVRMAESYVRGVRALGVDTGVVESERRDRSAVSPWLAPLVRPPVEHIPTVQMVLPVGIVSRPPYRPTIALSMFETDRLPELFARPLRQVDRALVPSAHCRDLWIAAGVPPERIRIVPLGVDIAAFDGSAPAAVAPDLPGGGRFADRKTRLLHVSAGGPRKNVPGLLTAWIAATRADDDAALWLRITHNRAGLAADVAGEIAEAERRAGRSLASAAPVNVDHAYLPDDTLPGVYTAATHYVSASFGEGWDLPMTEAGASGLTLIAPDHTGYREYLDPSVATLIPSREAPAFDVPGGWYEPLVAGANWWEPEREALAAAIRDAIDGRSRATGARDRIRARFSELDAAAALLTAIADVALPG